MPIVLFIFTTVVLVTAAVAVLWHQFIWRRYDLAVTTARQLHDMLRHIDRLVWGDDDYMPYEPDPVLTSEGDDYVCYLKCGEIRVSRKMPKGVPRARVIVHWYQHMGVATEFYALKRNLTVRGGVFVRKYHEATRRMKDHEDKANSEAATT